MRETKESPRSLSNLSISLSLLPETEEREERHARKTRKRGIKKRSQKQKLLTSDFNSGSGFSAAAVAEDGLLAALLLSAATTLMFLLLDDFCANCLLDKDLVVERTEDAMRALDEDEQAIVLDILCCAFCVLNTRLALLCRCERNKKGRDALWGTLLVFYLSQDLFYAVHLGFSCTLQKP